MGPGGSKPIDQVRHLLPEDVIHRQPHRTGLDQIENAVDSIFAIDAKSGDIVWQTQVRTTDTWNISLPFNPLIPVDTDFGQSPSIFKLIG